MAPRTRKTPEASTITERKYPHMFVVAPEKLNEGVKTGGGRKPSVSKFHADMAEAVKERGTVFGIPITETDKVTTIQSQLRIAAKAHGVKITILVRDKASEPFVGFKVNPDEPADETATAPAE